MNDTPPPRATWLVLAIYTLIAALCALLWWRGQVPFPFLGSDAGDIASLAAAWLDPGRFRGDLLLGDWEAYRFYVTLQIPLLIALSYVFGDVGTAYVALLAPSILLHALGLYLLGRELLKHWWEAALLGLLGFGTVSLTIDYYGTYVDAQPRLMFQSVLPFLWIASLRLANRPRLWPILFAAHGLTMYLHSVSAPAVAFASLLALGGTRPPATSMIRHLSWLAASGATFLAVAGPFLWNYLVGHVHGSVTGYAEIIALYTGIFELHFTDVAEYLSIVVRRWQAGVLLPLWGIVGFVAVWKLAPNSRRALIFFGLWLAGLLVVSVGVSWVAQVIERRYELLPVQIDLRRNVRYVVPVLFIVGFWGTALTLRCIGRRAGSVALMVVAIGWLAIDRPGSIPFRATFSCLADGRLLCPPARWHDNLAVLEFLRTDLASGSRVLPVVARYEGLEFVAAIRYHARRPVVFNYKDAGFLAYSDHGRLERWRAFAGEMNRIHDISNGTAKLAAALALAQTADANIVVAEFPVRVTDLPFSWIILFKSGRYSVLGLV